MGSNIRVGVVGGNFGESHILGFQHCPEIEVIAICRRQRDLAQQLAQRYHIKGLYTDFDEMVQSKDIDVVSLAVPHHLHYPMTMRALDHGKHVLCEKPLALDVEQATEMARKAERAGLIHMTVFNWRFAPAILRMKELIEKGEIGQTYHVFFSWLTSRRKNRESRFFWRFARTESGFGVLGDSGVHGIDLIQWIVGDFRKVVSHMAICVPEHRADTGEYKKTEVEDSCSFLGQLNSGAQVIFYNSAVASCDRVIRLEVYGDKGFLGVHLFPSSQDYYGRLLGGKGEKSPDTVIPIPRRLKLDMRPLDERVTPSALFFARFARQLVKAIQTGQAPSPNFFDGLKAQKVLQALVTSWEKKQWADIC